MLVFTDEDCLNTVFRGAIVGSPSYGPREVGPLAMPTDTNGVLAARDSFLSFGQEPESKTAEGINVKTTELDLAADSGTNNTGLPPSQVVKPAFDAPFTVSRLPPPLLRANHMRSLYRATVCWRSRTRMPPHGWAFPTLPPSA